jgi:hypothetical protein
LILERFGERRAAENLTKSQLWNGVDRTGTGNLFL